MKEVILFESLVIVPCQIHVLFNMGLYFVSNITTVYNGFWWVTPKMAVRKKPKFKFLRLKVILLVCNIESNS